MRRCSACATGCGRQHALRRDAQRIFQEARNLLIACHFKHLIHEIRFNFGDAFSFVGMSEMKRMPAVNGVGLYGGVTCARDEA